jgi:hypothetical protein
MTLGLRAKRIPVCLGYSGTFGEDADRKVVVIVVVVVVVVVSVRAHQLLQLLKYLVAWMGGTAL